MSSDTSQELMFSNNLSHSTSFDFPRDQGRCFIDTFHGYLPENIKRMLTSLLPRSRRAKRQNIDPSPELSDRITRKANRKLCPTFE